jgi:transposase
MPTKKRRVQVIPDNLPAITTPEETCPSLFTGTKLAEKDPEKYARVVQKLAEGMSMNRVARQEKVSSGTVAAISKREHRTVDAVQSLTSGLTSYASQACLERIIQKLEADEMPAGVLPICFGILRDKERADLGQASTIIEHKRTVTIDEVRSELEAMKKDAIEVKVEDL